MAQINLPLQTTPSNPPANTVDLFYSSSFTPPAMAVIDENGNVCRVGGFATQDYRLIRVTYIHQGTTSYTPTSGTRVLFVECWGAGAGGGGVATAATNSGAAGGGGAGAYAAKWVTSNVGGSHTGLSVGAGGAGAAAGNNTGTAGGDTTFKDNTGASVVVAKGGSGGGGDAIATIHAGGVGGAGGLASSSTGDIKQDGCPGESGFALAAAQALSGFGAAGFEGGGGSQGHKTQGAGGNATGYAGGGAGGCALSGGASVAGGNGGNGLIRVWEFA